MEVPRLTDGRIILDALEPSDAEALVALDDGEIRRWYSRDTPRTLAEARRLIDAAAVSWAYDGPPRVMAIRRAPSCELIGVVSVIPRRFLSIATRSPRLGVLLAAALSHEAPDIVVMDGWLGKDARGRGLGARVLRLSLDYVFDDYGATMVEGQARSGNARVMTLMAYAGFEFYGGDAIQVYRITPERWRARRHKFGRTRPGLDHARAGG